jgi:hypothetical protein
VKVAGAGVFEFALLLSSKANDKNSKANPALATNRRLLFIFRFSASVWKEYIPLYKTAFAANWFQFIRKRVCRQL